jgi:hypothetical protein
LERKIDMEKLTTARAWAQGFVGVALAIVAIAAVRVDVLNNLEYGRTISDEMATIMVLAAVCVCALPAAAAMAGWNGLLKLTTGVCVVLTVWAAVNAYAARQGAQILSAQKTETQYRDAQADAEAARAEARTARDDAARITETASVAALVSLKDDAAKAVKDTSAKAEEDGIACLSSKRCREASATLAAITARLGAAETKAAALARADKADAKVKEAKADASSGPAEASMVATWIAGRTGADANDVARTIGLTMTGAVIVVTQGFALLGHLAVTLMAGAVATIRGGRKSKGSPSPRGGKPKLADVEQTSAQVISLKAARKARNTRAGTSASAQRSAHNAILKAQVAELLAKGHSVNEVARLINAVGRSTIQRWAREVGRPEVAKKAATV